MKTKIICLLFLLPMLQCHAQFLKTLGNKAANAAATTTARKVEEKTEKKTGEVIDKVLDPQKKEAKSNDANHDKNHDKNDNSPTRNTEESASKTDKKQSDNPTQEVKSAADFVAGDKVIVMEDFIQDAIGDFPVNWLTNTSGEVVTLSDSPQRWLKLTGKGAYTITDIKKLPLNFTFEFDLYANPEFSYYSTFLHIAFIESLKKNEYATWEEYSDGKEGVRISLSPITESDGEYLGRSKMKVVSEREKVMENELKISSFNRDKQNLVKVQFWRQKNRLRVYVGGKKIWDLPNAFQEANYNGVVFFIDDYHTTEDKYCISNLRLAEAGIDTRHKLLQTGTFTTNEILFDVGKATIKPSSAKVIDEIGKVLKENPSIKVSITGHTDSDGDDKKNLELSEFRAMAVKTELVRKFELNEDNIQVIGIGETQPIAPNTTEEGKKQNRRVEFKVLK